MKPLSTALKMTLAAIGFMSTVAMGQTFGSSNAQLWTQEQETAQEFTQFLNQQYQGLNLVPKRFDRQATEQMFQLENWLQGQQKFGPRTFDNLNCTKIVCGGGGGNCTTCLH